MDLARMLLRRSGLPVLAGGLVAVLTLTFGALFHWPVLLVILILVGLALVVAIVVLVRQLQSTRAAEDIESTINRQAEQDIERSVPGQAGALQDLKTQLLARIAALKERRGGQAALSTLPWYMVLGPARSGKSTLLARSDLQFPDAGEGESGGPVAGLGGTRGFGWWLCSDAVLLDLPGRAVGASAEFEDTDDWLAFLRVLAKRRRGKPLNGALVVVGLDQLAGRPDDEIDKLARGVRERLQELVHELGVVFPAYLVFSKADLLAGFTEYFADLTPEERGQAWGATFDLDRARDENAAELFDTELHHLSVALSGRRLARVAALPEPAPRARAFAFPRQLEQVRFPLRRFVQVLFERDATQESPFLRGFYFTSAVQEGAPLDRVIEVEARHAGLEAAPVGRPAAGPGPLFLRELLAAVVFPDADLAMASTRAGKRTQRLRALYAGGLAAAFAGLTILFSALSCANGGVINATRRAAQDVALTRSSTLGDQLDALERLHVQLVKLDTLTRRKPLWRRVGGYSGDAAFEPAWQQYTDAALEHLVLPAVTTLGGDLPARAAGREGSFIDFYESYRTWRLLSDARALAPRDSTTVSRVLRHLFRDRLGATMANLAAPPPALLSSQVAFLTEHPDWLWKQGAGRVPKADELLIRSASARIRDEWSVGLAQFYGRMLDEVARMEPAVPGVAVSDLLRSRNIAPTVLVAAGDDRVPGCFTREGWERQVKPLIEGYRADQDPHGGVLAEAFLGAPPDLADSLVALYARDYEAHWLRYLGALQLPAHTPAAVWADQAALFARKDDSPVVAMVQQVDQQTTLGELPGSPLAIMQGHFQAVHEFTRGAEQAGGRRPGFWTRVGRFFGGVWAKITRLFGRKAGTASPFASPRDNYLDRLDPVRQKIVQVVNQASDPSGLATDPDFIAARGWIQNTYAGRGAVAETMAQLLGLPLRSAGRVPSPGIQKAYDEVRAQFAKIQDRYPLVADAGEEANLKDFADFFKPDGVFWKFYDEKLQGRVSRDGKALPGQEISDLSPAFLACLARADSIRNAFEWKETGPSVRFSVRPSIPTKIQGPEVNLRQLFLDLGGNRAVYRNGYEGQTMDLEWPGPAALEGVQLRAEVGIGPPPDALVGKGAWGFFRLLEGNLDEVGGVIRATWTVSAGATRYRVVYEIVPVSRDHPFHADFLRFRLPGTVNN